MSRTIQNGLEYFLVLAGLVPFLTIEDSTTAWLSAAVGLLGAAVVRLACEKSQLRAELATRLTERERITF